MSQIKIDTTYYKQVFLFVAFYFLVGCSAIDKQNNWDSTVQHVKSGVVNIQYDVPVSFDDKWNSSSYATGFIVDAAKGIILTNRHVVTPGPVTAKAILINNEEIDLTPLYIDPVHDFGFYRYNPDDIKFIKPHEFQLSNKMPNVGDDIRIIGNDAGQKISILDGTISRLDRDAPNYGKGSYNDFNIFYIQASTASTGGSSGSPVININGEVVALNAGSQSKSANAFYLPLGPIKLALNKLQNNEAIVRGTFQTTFKSTAYPELKRLGLSDVLAAKYRDLYPELKGLLVVRKIIPTSPAAEKLVIGDILLTVNKQPVAKFSELEQSLNEHVNQALLVTVLRRGIEQEFSIQVANLDDISPSALLKFDGSVFHNLSYQQARHYNKPISGVYVARSASFFKQAGVPNKSVITEFNGVKVNNIKAFNEQLQNIENGKKVNLRYFNFKTINTTNYALVEINRTWFEHSYCEKDEQLNTWPCTKFSETLTKKSPLTNTSEQSSVVVTEKIEDALVSVSFHSPYSIQGRSGGNARQGTGVIVDVNKGWVVVPRSVIFSMLGDVKLVFNNKLEITGKVEYIHPLHNLALVSYSPALLNNVNVAQAKFSAETLQPGDVILQAGLNYSGLMEYRETQVDTTEEFWLNQFNVPQFVDKNIEATYLVNPSSTIDGVLLNSNNEVTALWTTFEYGDSEGKGVERATAGFSADYVLELIDVIENGKAIYSLETYFTQIAPVDALKMGLSNDWLIKLQQNNADVEKLLAIYNVAANTPSSKLFKRGDILLSVNGTPVSSFRQVEKLSQKPIIQVTYFSEGQIHHKEMHTTALYGDDISRVVHWSGLFLHEPHRAAKIQGDIDESGIYVASYQYGSPASRYKLYAMQRIVEVDGTQINSMDDFIEAVKGKKHKDSVHIKVLSFENIPQVLTLRVDNNYWPFYEVKHENGIWSKNVYLQ